VQQRPHPRETGQALLPVVAFDPFALRRVAKSG
jgi:hypothetical protein